MSKAWLRLLRAPLGLTVVWDFACGLWLAGLPWIDSSAWALASLLCCYYGGMVLNDWRDLAQDRAAGRARPLVTGAIQARLALAVGLLLLLASYLCAWQAGPGLAEFATWLIALVLVYDLSGPALRAHLGPALLATARTFSLCYPVVHQVGSSNLIDAIGLAAPLTYALYFLFLSRLAQREESGVRGLNGLSYLVMAAITPAIVVQIADPSWPFYLGWLLLLALLLPKAWRRRHQAWSPQEVKVQVATALGAAPILPAIMLYSVEGMQWWIPLLALPLLLILRRAMRCLVVN